MVTSLLVLIWFGSLIYFIVLWRQKRSARLKAGANYEYDENYIEISKNKRIVGMVCIGAFLLAGLLSPSKEHSTEDQTVATIQEASKDDKARREIEKLEAEQKRETEKLEREKQKEAEKLERQQREEVEKAEKERKAVEQRQIREQEREARAKAEIEGHNYEEVSVNTLLNDLESNAARASRMYKDKYVKIVGGVVENIESDGDYITIDRPGGFGLTAIQCYPKNGTVEEQVFNLNRNQQVVIYGKVIRVGEILGYSVDLLKLE